MFLIFLVLHKVRTRLLGRVIARLSGLPVKYCETIYFGIHEETQSPNSSWSWLICSGRRPCEEPGRPVAGVARGPEPSRDSDPTPS